LYYPIISVVVVVGGGGGGLDELLRFCLKWFPHPYDKSDSYYKTLPHFELELLYGVFRHLRIEEVLVGSYYFMFFIPCLF